MVSEQFIKKISEKVIKKVSDQVFSKKAIIQVIKNVSSPVDYAWP